MQLRCGHRIITDGCKICTELQSKWYKKLAKEGFDDAENFSYKDRPLHAWHRNILNTVTTIEVELVIEKYDRAQDLLHRFDFKTEIHKKIWELHCEGLSRIAIEKAIAHLANTYKQSQIRNIIKDLERELAW